MLPLYNETNFYVYFYYFRFCIYSYFAVDWLVTCEVPTHANLSELSGWTKLVMTLSLFLFSFFLSCTATRWPELMMFLANEQTVKVFVSSVWANFHKVEECLKRLRQLFFLMNANFALSDWKWCILLWSFRKDPVLKYNSQYKVNETFPKKGVFRSI